MTIKATFSDGTVMMFGDSYRTWFNQLEEFCRSYKKQRPQVVKCSTAWIAYGGLKWCSEDDFQSELDDEGKGRTLKSFSKWKPLNDTERRTLERYVKRAP